MPGCRNLKGLPGERSRFSYGQRLDDQAPQLPNCREEGDTYHQYEHSSTRYTMYGTDIPHPVTNSLGSLEQACNVTFVQSVSVFGNMNYDSPSADAWQSHHQTFQPIQGGPAALADPETPQRQHPQVQAPIRGSQPIDGIGHQDSFSVQPSHTQTALDLDWQYTAQDDIESMEAPGQDGIQLAEDWGESMQHHGWCNNESIDFVDTADTISEMSLNLDDFAGQTDAATPDLKTLASNPIDSVGRNIQPWSPYAPNDHGWQQCQQNVNLLVNHIESATTSRSTYTAGTLESSYVFINTPGISTMSSISQHTQDMVDSGLTLRPNQEVSLDPETEFDDGDLDQIILGLSYRIEPPPGGINGSVSNPGMANQSLLPVQSTSFLQPTPGNSVYDYAASTTASTPSAPDTIQCRVCGKEYSGKFRVGNLARHKRYKHNGAVVLGCLDRSCNKVFKRQDARLKHVRKHHPELASDPVPRPEQRKGPNTLIQHQFDQNYELNNVGSRFEQTSRAGQAQEGRPSRGATPRTSSF
ncbi:hypothetical protein BU25DRAFT_144460 [Macroventuria anomochaeta]|uniref:Uncharacterized protein n=1 Tax=Macroventuria anomochaeta TaxID=301207 RepID=A0ACB6SDV8_9PLEO|nr:uncharacterized protein BU25DRAFT_144460 [Macroventuria anomochaeta]KAF2632224.1 hypothetical protein BU25DRAFT_144460 [Macroventuria anomochaeta]